MSNDSSDTSSADPVSTPPSAAKTESPKKEKASQKKPVVPWGPLGAIVYGLLVLIGSQFIASLVLYNYTIFVSKTDDAGAWLDGSIAAQFWFTVLAEAIAFGAIWWYVRYRGAAMRAIGWVRLRLRDIVYALAGFGVYFVGAIVLTVIVAMLFPSIDFDQRQDIGFETVVGNLDLLLTFISLVVLPPIVEETLFRGFIYTGLRTKMAWVWTAIVTSALFAIAHLQFGNGAPLLWAAAIDTFALSLVLCYMREKTGSLWPGILLHGLKNGIAFVTLYVVMQ